MRLWWAVRLRYLSSKDNKWHRHTTKWYEESDRAWDENDRFLASRKDILESSSALIHK